MRSTRLIVNLNNIKDNIKEIKSYLGSDIEIMPIVKAAGYGTHLNYCPDILNQFNYVGVALLDEAIILRNNGYKNNIFILYPLSKDELQIAIKEKFIVNGSNIFELNEEYTEDFTIHLEVETGMGRTGIQEKKLDRYLKKLKENSNIKLEGIYTHLSSCSSDEDFSLIQINRFNRIIEKVESKGFYPKYKHVCCSGGLKKYKNYLFNMVRIGLLIYGYYPNEGIKDILRLKPSMVLKTNISFIKTIDKGETVGYNKNFIAERKTKVATIPLGFGDGLLTLETGEPYVIVNNKKAKIIGICMDNMMIDVTDIENIKLNDEVYIWDNENITVEQIGIWCNDICNYEVISSISERVPRILKG